MLFQAVGLYNETNHGTAFVSPKCRQFNKKK